MSISVRHPVAHLNYSAYQRNRLGKALQEQERIATALDRSHNQTLRNIATRMYSCCANAMIAVDDETDELRVHERRCNARTCQYCKRIRANRCLARMLAAVEKMNSPRFITLTVRSDDKPLREQIQHLRDSFARLRRSRPWKAHIHGGIYTLEITWNENAQRWHPHVHIIADSEYWKQQDLSAAWEIASQGSPICDIRFVYDRKTQVRYLATYATKSSDLAKLPTYLIAEYVEETRSLRYLQAFGTLHGEKLIDDEDDEPHAYAEKYSAEELAGAAQRGDHFALALLRWIQRGTPDPIPDGLAAHLADADTEIETPAGVLRYWRTRRKDLHSGRDPATTTRPEHHRPRDRTIGLWQEPDSAGYPDRDG